MCISSCRRMSWTPSCPELREPELMVMSLPEASIKTSENGRNRLDAIANFRECYITYIVAVIYITHGGFVVSSTFTFTFHIAPSWLKIQDLSAQLKVFGVRPGAQSPICFLGKLLSYLLLNEYHQIFRWVLHSIPWFVIVTIFRIQIAIIPGYSPS